LTASAPTVHVVDDDDSFRTAISRLLRASGYEVEAYPSAGEFLLEPSPPGPACLLLDLHMPGPDGLELQEAIARRGDSLPVIFLTAHGDIRKTVRAMRQGAADFLTKPVKREELLKAVRSALDRQRQEELTAGWRRELASRYALLTPREREVLARVVRGALNKQIGAVLGMTERTVKAHRAKIMQKMQVDSLAELVLANAALRQRGAHDRPHAAEIAED
jgi:FixJ family two-component response regulator